jgi:hypothetical protein
MGPLQLRIPGRALIALVCLALLAPAVALAVTYRTGKYVGDTSQGTRIGFKLTKTAARGIHFDLTLTCTDGGEVEFTFVGGDENLTKKGTFSFTTHPGAGVSTHVDGKIVSKKKVTGHLRRRSHNSKGAACDSGKVAYTAKHKH